MATQNPQKLKRVIITYFILSNFLIGLIGFGGASYSFYGQLTDLTLAKLGQTAAARAEAISEWLRLVIIVGTQPSRQSWGKMTLENHYQGVVSREDLVETTAKVIDGALTYNHDIKGMARLDRGGRVILHRGQEIPASFQPNLSPDLIPPRLSLFTTGGGPQLIVLSPLRGRGGMFLGADVVLLDTDPLLRLLSDSYDASFNNRTFLTVGKDGGDALVYAGGDDDAPRPAAEIAGPIEQALASDSKTVVTDDLVYAVGQVGGADWRIVIAADKQLLLKPVTDQILRTIGYFLLFFLFALTGLWFLALRPLTGRVEQTTEALEEEVEETAEKLLREAEGRKKTESRLVAATHRAQVAREAKSQFLTNLSHEIRTPLNAVIGMTDLTLFTDLTGEQRSYLEEVQRAAGRLLEQINDLLDLSKLQDGLLITESRTFHLMELLEQSARVFEAVEREKGLAFVLEVEPGLAPHRLGDPFRLKQVLHYLLDNAFKFTDRGEVRLKVSAWPEGGEEVPGDAPGPDPARDGGRLLFEVRDSGVGISEDRLPTIFDLFVQADSSLTRNSGGTGMGLAVAKRLVELMDGEMWVESSPGRGSSFKLAVSLPPASDGPAEDQAELGAPLSLEDLRGLTALAADDNEVNRKILAGYLNHWGLASLCFASGGELEAYLRDNPGCRPDVFILDVLMPGPTTGDLEEKLLAARPGTPVIFLSSAAASVSETVRPDGGRTVTLGKPIDQELLLRQLAVLLSGRKAAAAEAPRPAGGLTKVEKPRKILVVDDNQLNRRLAVTLLSKRGHEVDEADNGREALNAISARKYDMVLMDIQMPVMDGLSAVREIRAFPEKYGASLPVVAMTAHALPGDQETFLKAGMTAYISKPFKPHELLAVAENFFEAEDISKYTGGSKVAAELDRAVIMENFMDDEELLFESIDLFLERIDARMAVLKQSVAEENPDVFMPEAHTIKGMIGIFSTGEAFEAAKKIEIKGRDKKVDGIAEDLAELEKSLAALVNALRDWRSGN